MRVRIYWNLHRGCWSVMDARTNRILGHATQVLVREPRFVVREAGRQRVLRERKKNVHAFVVGQLEAAIWTHAGCAFTASGWGWDNDRKMNNTYRNFANSDGRQVSYNPFHFGHFYRVADTEIDRAVHPVTAAPMAYLTWENRKGADLTPKSRVVIFDPCQMPARVTL